MKNNLYKSCVFSCLVAVLFLSIDSSCANAFPEQAEVYLRSDPTGASVALNGKTVGVSPLNIPALPPGKNLVSLTLQGYLPLFRTVELEPGQRTVMDFKLEPRTGLLLIHSTPSGAELEINGVHRGNTPALITDLTAGVHQILLSTSGFLPRRLEVMIEDRQPKRIYSELTPDTAVIIVNARPSGADVFVDGIRQGQSPCTLEDVRTGEIAFRISTSGHHPFSETLVLRAGERREVNVSLVPEPSSLRVTTTPDGVKIFVNDRFRGRSPVLMEDLPAGEYSIRAELEAHDTEQRTIRIGLGQDHLEEFSLSANAGHVEITTEPAGAVVFLNGVSVGETEPEPGKTDNISARFILPLVPVGSHELKLTRGGYFPFSEQIEISRNETHTAHYRLERRFIPNVEVRTLNETYRGVLTERNRESIRLELRPGVFKTLLNDEITALVPLRSLDPADEDPKTPSSR